MEKLKKNILFCVFFLLVCTLICPVVIKVVQRLQIQTNKNTVYSIINKTTMVSSSNNEENQIYKIENDQLINISTKEIKNYNNKTYKNGFIIVNKEGNIATQLVSKNNCVTKDFKESDITFKNNCDELEIAKDIFNLKEKDIKVTNINEIPELLIIGVENIFTNYKIYDNYNNEISKENIINNGTYKIVYSIYDKENNLLFTKSYNLVCELETEISKN